MREKKTPLDLCRTHGVMCMPRICSTSTIDSILNDNSRMQIDDGFYFLYFQFRCVNFFVLNSGSKFIGAYSLSTRIHIETHAHPGDAISATSSKCEIRIADDNFLFKKKLFSVFTFSSQFASLCGPFCVHVLCVCVFARAQIFVPKSC